MKKKALWKDIKKCFSNSKGRFFSIMCLVALGSFALVGLQVAGPDMRKTGTDYFDSLNLADVSIIGDYGIDSDNVEAINRVTGAEKIEYGYLKDVVIDGTNTGVRVFSETKGISDYELVSGRMPEKPDEIAVASFLSEKYKIGKTITFSEKEDIAGNHVLKNDTFKIVGYVNSSELLSIINMGQSTAGTGELEGYAVVTSDAFDSEVYMIARLKFNDTNGVDPYSNKYTKLITAQKNELDKLLEKQPSLRLNSIKTEYQEKIDDARAKVDDAKSLLADNEDKLNKGESELAAAKRSYYSSLAQYNKSKNDAQKEFSKNEASLKMAKDALSEKRDELNVKWQQYNENKAQFDMLKKQKAQLDAAQAALDPEIAAAENSTGMSIEEIERSLPALKESLPEEEYQKLAGLVSAKKELDAKWQAYNSAAAGLEDAEEKLSAAKTELDAAEKEYELAAAQISENEKELSLQKAKAQSEFDAAATKLNTAAAKIAESEKQLNEGRDEFNSKKADAEKEIAEGEEKIAKAQSALDGLKKPVYTLDTRREIPGAEGYKVYGTISEIIDSLADVFPIFLYFVAALVTLTTMTRFVDEERTNSGTLKALGYENHDILKKFTVYGLTAGNSGAILGIVAGHTLLPLIVYAAYGESFTYPKLELHFYPGISLMALLLAFLCTVLPAFIVAGKELTERPAALLMPKAPASGSKILLERIRPVWNRMNFTHKVTARNIFRYKKRMLMTIFGVCGSVTLIFAGFSVQHSISGVKDRQFGEIMKYDLIVAEKDGLSDEESEEIKALLDSTEVNSKISVYYETVTKTAGKNNDTQSIKLIVAENSEELTKYIRLCKRSSGEALKLTDNGCIISERFAKLLNVKIGDSFKYTDDSGNSRTVKISGITEMYTGHFIFMNSEYYKSVYGKTYTENAHLVTLKDRSSNNAKLESGRFIQLDGVKGVVQNTTMTNQIDTIVNSLNMIMRILIIVAILLAAVILYNLTNINVSERIRELSTIKVLGFYNKEVTMYIYRETILLTVIGILVGFGFGDALYRYILAVVPPDDVMFNPALGAKAFIIPVIVIMGITAILGVMMNRRLKNIDMLEALKSVD